VVFEKQIFIENYPVDLTSHFRWGSASHAVILAAALGAQQCIYTWLG
jgi:hypothetical protein